jgi:hypothetical protein
VKKGEYLNSIEINTKWYHGKQCENEILHQFKVEPPTCLAIKLLDIYSKEVRLDF